MSKLCLLRSNHFQLKIEEPTVQIDSLNMWLKLGPGKDLLSLAQSFSYYFKLRHLKLAGVLTGMLV